VAGNVPRARGEVDLMNDGKNMLDGLGASELAGKQMLTRIFIASLVPFETAARMRKHFRIRHHYWTLVASS